jgi:glycosyltransferase involved in cell wall biosynthesis
MIVYNYFPIDPRVRREATALIEAGYKVDVICLCNLGESFFDTFEGIDIYRINISKNRESRSNYIFLYLYFFLKAFLKINKLYLKNRYHIYHFHNMPDFLVFAGIFQKILGKKIVLDLHDPMPEVFISKYLNKTSNLIIKFIVFQEKISIKFADQVITTNIAFRDKFLERGCPANKISIVMNTPQETVFNIGQKTSPDVKDQNKFVVMYHGAILERHGLDDAVKALNYLIGKIPDLYFWVFGQGEFTDKFLNEVEKFELQKVVQFKGLVSLEEIARTIPVINLGLIPNKLNEFTNINFPTRIFEYIYFKKPVIVPRTIGISDYFNDESIYFFEPGKVKHLAEVILNVYKNYPNREEIVERGYSVYRNFTWARQKSVLVNLMEKLVNKEHR